MRVLLLCDRYPWPLTNGQNLRIHHYVRALKEQHTFDLGCYADAPSPPEIRPLFRNVFTWTRPKFEKPEGVRRLLEAFNVDNFVPGSGELRKYLASADSKGEYDLFWVSGWDCIVNIPEQCRTPVLADAVDDGVLEYWREVKSAARLSAKLTMLKRLMMNAAFERKYFGRASRVLFVSDLDASSFARICPGTPVSVVNNGVDEDFFRPLGGPREPNRIVFEGNIGFPPNADGMTYFVGEILPLVRAAIPNVVLTIVGKDPSEEVRRLAGPNVEVTGYVDDVRPYVDRAAVFICPLRKGAGIKNKVLQAWAMGKAVVATSVSVGGLLAHDGQNIIIRDDPTAFAGELIALLRDRVAAERLGAGARKTVLESYTWRAKARELGAVIDSVMPVGVRYAHS